MPAAARPDGELLTWRAAGLELALADATVPFFMQWDRPPQYPGLWRVGVETDQGEVSIGG